MVEVSKQGWVRAWALELAAAQLPPLKHPGCAPMEVLESDNRMDKGSGVPGDTMT